jgi:hypothetical protein
LVRFAALGNAGKQENRLKRGDAVMSLGDGSIFAALGNAGEQENQMKQGDAVMSLGENNIWHVSRHWGTLKSKKIKLKGVTQ